MLEPAAAPAEMDHLDVGVDLWTFTDRLGELMLSVNP